MEETLRQDAFFGRWWVPKTPGQAYFSRLDIDTRNRGLLQTVPKYWPQSDVAFGTLSDDRRATLARQRVDSLRAPWMELFVGAHLEKAEELRIVEARISFRKFHTSSHFRRFSLIRAAEEPCFETGSWPEHPVYSAENQFEDSTISMSVSIENADRLVWDEHDGKPFRIIQPSRVDPVLIMRTDGPVPFSEMKEKLLDLQDFISFGMGRAAIVDRVKLVTDDGAELEYFGRWRSRYDHTGGLGLGNMLFSLDQVRLDHALSAWHQALVTFYPAPQVITYRYCAPGFLEHDLSASVSAIENMYSQLKMPRRYVDSTLDGRDSIREILLSAPPSKARRVALRSIGTRDSSFADKLRALSAQLPSSLFETLQFSPEEWIEEVKEQRNTISHSASHVAKPGVNASVDLERGIARSRIILIALIMQKSGFPASAMESAIRGFASEKQITREPSTALAS